MHDYLLKILKHKSDEVAALKHAIATDPEHPINKLLQERTPRKHKKSFKKALQSTSTSVIAEIKRQSPSKGKLATIPNPTLLAKKYANGGASAISVLTDHFAFGGSIEDLKAVSAALSNTDVAILRKDFIIDKIQIAEAIVAGADAVLLIVAALKEKTKTLLDYCHSLNIEALVEVHSHEELKYALDIGADIIGVNNRDLTTFNIDHNNALQLKTHIPDHVVSIAESGIHSLATARQYASAGYDGLLIGEALVKSNHPERLITAIKTGHSTHVKICGLRDPELAAEAVKMGANYIGIMFYKASSRYVDIDTAGTITNAVKKAGGTPVAVFVDTAAQEMKSICEDLGIDVVQLHLSLIHI